MLPILTEKILLNWREFFPTLDRPHSVSYLGIPGSVEGGTATFMAFASMGSEPLYVVKAHRDPNAANRALGEKDVLRSLQHVGSTISSTIPEVLLCERIGSVWVLVQTVLSGRPMTTKVDQQGLPEPGLSKRNFDLASRWLSDLHFTTLVRSEISIEVLKTEYIEVLEEFVHAFDLTLAQIEYLDAITERLPAIARLGGVINHSDFCRHNILLGDKGNRDEMRVIDWTDSKMTGLPLQDLFFFLTTYYLQARRQTGMKGFIQAFEDTFFNRNTYSALVTETVRNFCKNIGVDVRYLETLFALFVVERSVMQLRQVSNCSKRGVLPRFSLSLAAAEGLGYEQTLKAQYWTHFFVTLAKRHDNFLGGV